MNEYTDTVKWLRYLLYVGIAAMVNTVLNIFLPAIASWLSPILTLAALYMMARLAASNGRYLRSILFNGAALVVTILNIQQVALAGLLCGIIGQYQEYHAHSELIADRDSKLAVKWSNLFFIQLGVNLFLVVMNVLSVAVFIGAAELDSVVISAIITVITAVILLILKIVYLVYLNRTVKVLEAVVE